MMPLADTPSEAARALLERRAARLLEAPAATEEEGSFWVAELTLGGVRYGLPLGALRAALPLRAVTPVPLAPRHVLGIVRFEGRILSAYSLASLLGVRGWAVDPAVLLVVDLGEEGLAVFDSEEVPRPVALPLLPVERARAADRRAERGVLEIVLPDEAPLHLLDAAALRAKVGEA